MFKLITRDSPGRIQIIDGLRGISILLMVLYHFGYDLVTFCGMPAWVMYNPVLDVLQPFFAGLFIFMSGISCRFSRNNIRRGVEILAAGLVVSLVTYLMDYFGLTRNAAIRFGILHLLGISAILYGILQKPLEKVKPAIQCVIYVCLFFLSFAVTGRLYETKCFFWLGLRYQGFASSDYFPLLPWLFVYLTGTAAGYYVVNRRLSERFYTIKMPFFATVGRNTLIIYLLHQPVLYGLSMLISRFV